MFKTRIELLSGLRTSTSYLFAPDATSLTQDRFQGVPGGTLYYAQRAVVAKYRISPGFKMLLRMGPLMNVASPIPANCKAWPQARTTCRLAYLQLLRDFAAFFCVLPPGSTWADSNQPRPEACNNVQLGATPVCVRPILCRRRSYVSENS